MNKAQKRWALGAALTLAAGSLLAMATPITASAAAPTPHACSHQPRVGHIAGIVAPTGHCPSNAVSIASDPANGTPPLLYHGGPVMMTPSTSPLVITPIFWSPTGHTMSSAYISLITTYLKDVAAASGTTSNVYSVANEYYGTNGQIHYSISSGAAITDTNALPSSGCRVARNDRTGIYSDGTGYNACLDDAQLQSQINTVTSAHGLPHNLSHIYVLLLPKAVESCFNAGSTTTSSNQCTINHNPSAAYCAYHSDSSSSAIYANMPFPIYQSGTGFTCGPEGTLGAVESPNNNPDADVEISPTSHEINEAITDPDTSTGWYDSSGFENGDECAYIFGATSGTAGHLYNQVINGGHFLTQEEFSNNDFAITAAGCVQSSSAEA